MAWRVRRGQGPLVGRGSSVARKREREREQVAEVTPLNRGRPLAWAGAQLGMSYGLFVGEVMSVRRHTRQFTEASTCRDESREGAKWCRGRSFPR